jgi:hypothetical protein
VLRGIPAPGEKGFFEEVSMIHTCHFLVFLLPRSALSCIFLQNIPGPFEVAVVAKGETQVLQQILLSLLGSFYLQRGLLEVFSELFQSIAG